MELQLKKIFRTYQGLITTSAIILVSTLGFIIVIIPLAQRIYGLSGEVTSVRGEVQSLEQKASILNSLDEDALKNDLVTLSSAVPADKSLMTLLATIDGVTSKTGVSLVDVSLTKPGSLATDSAKKLNVKEATLGSNIISFVLSVSGSYDQIHAFMKTIGSVRRFLRIRSFDVSIVGPDVTARITMDAFYYPFPKNVGAVNQKINVLTSKEEQTIHDITSIELASGQTISTNQLAPAVILPVGKSDPFSN